MLTGDEFSIRGLFLKERLFSELGDSVYCNVKYMFTNSPNKIRFDLGNSRIEDFTTGIR